MSKINPYQSPAIEYPEDRLLREAQCEAMDGAIGNVQPILFVIGMIIGLTSAFAVAVLGNEWIVLTGVAMLMVISIIPLEVVRPKRCPACLRYACRCAENREASRRTTSQIVLAPCPYCGSEADWCDPESNFDPPETMIICRNKASSCGEIFDNDEAGYEETAAAYNRRATPIRLAEVAATGNLPMRT